MTMNNTWGFKKDDHNWKTTQDLLHKLVDIVSKGGNFLLNVGPTAEGLIPEPSVQRLAEVGAWMEVNGESVYGTSASPFKRLAWGRCTQKPGTLYLHVFNWPGDGRLVVPGLSNEVTKAYLLADQDAGPLKTSRAGEDVVVEVPAQALDPIDTVVVLQIAGEPQITAGDVKQAPDRSITLHARDAETHGANIKYEQGGGKDNIGYWTKPADYVTWVCRVTDPAKFQVELTYACPQPGGSDFVVEVADHKLEGKVEATGDWTKFETKALGTVELGADRHILTVKAKNLVGEGVMNLKAIVLKPVKP
jgi:alpha-L-fucosidase